MNGDTITNVNLQEMLIEHHNNRNLATVFTHDDAIHTGGTYIFDKIVLSHIPQGKVYSIKDDLMPQLIKKKEVGLYKNENEYYFDIGTFEGLQKAKEYFE